MAAVEPMDFSSYRLGQQHEALSLDQSEDVRQAGLALIRQARREVIVISRHLDPGLYNNTEFATAVRDFVVNNRYARLRVLVRDADPAVRSGHRLIELSQRLSSFIEIRIPDQQFDGYNSALLVVDAEGYLYREQADLYHAQCSFADRKFSDGLCHQFEEMWDSSHPDMNLRRMLL